MSGSDNQSGDEVPEFQQVSSYLDMLKGIGRYVVALEGLPVAWSKDLTQEKAEELVALATDATLSITGFSKWVDPKSLIVSVESGSKSFSMLNFQNLIVIVEGKPEIANRALRNVLSKLSGTSPKCPYCGGDFSAKAFRCSKCGSPIPFGLSRCPFCGSALRILKCPYCGKAVSFRGKKIVVRRSSSGVRLGAALTGLGIITALVLLFLGGSAAMVPAVSSGSILGVAGLITIASSKEIAEEAEE